MQPTVPPERNSNWKNIVIILLSVTVLILAIVLLYDKNKSTQNLAGPATAEKARIEGLSMENQKRLLALLDLANTTSEGDGEEIKDIPSSNGAVNDFIAEIGKYYNVSDTLTPPNRILTRGVSFDINAFMIWAQKVHDNYHPVRFTIKLSRYTDDFINKQFADRPNQIPRVRNERLGRFTLFLCACKADHTTLATNAAGQPAPMLNLGHLYP